MKLLQEIPTFKNIDVAFERKPFSIDRLNTQCITVFYFWSKECSLCKGVHPFFYKMVERYNKNVQIVVIHDGDVALNELPNMPSDVVMLIDRKRELGNLFNVNYFPALYVFDENRLLRFKQQGSNQMQIVFNRIDRLVKKL